MNPQVADISHLTSLPTRLSSRGTAGEWLGHYLWRFEKEATTYSIGRRFILSLRFQENKYVYNIPSALGGGQSWSYPCRLRLFGVCILSPTLGSSMVRRLSSTYPESGKPRVGDCLPGSPMVLAFLRYWGMSWNLTRGRLYPLSSGNNDIFLCKGSKCRDDWKYR